jgi:transcriptional regulator with XRE-family HTH domain
MRKSTKPVTVEDIDQRAAWNLRALLAGERWSGRKAATALGLAPMYVTRRLNGQTEISFSDIVLFAGLLHMAPGELTERLYNETPTTNGGEGLVSLPRLDSNQQPFGITPDDSGLAEVVELAAWRDRERELIGVGA